MAVMTTFSIERFSDVIHEAEPLLDRHWAEIALHKDIVPLSPDYARYTAWEAAGKMMIAVARVDGALVAYAPFLIDRHHHYSVTLWSHNDIIYVSPEWRTLGIGNGILDLAEAEMRERGCVVVQIESKVAHPELAALLRSRGYEMTGIIHSKVLARPESG